MSSAWGVPFAYFAEDGDVVNSDTASSFPIICTSNGSDMTLGATRRIAEESPTRVSSTATMHNAVINTIFNREHPPQEHHQAPYLSEASQYDQNTVSLSQKTRLDEVSADSPLSSLDKLRRCSPKLKYDIAKLVELGDQIQDSSEVLLKVKPEAIAENLFQFLGVDRHLRLSTRSRGLSDISNFSRRSMISDEWEPSRQPRAAPRASDAQHTSRLQQHEGFVRFLKQHASPPHQRVTAGGRIVPNGPLSPPPMFDYASLNGLMQGQQMKTQAFSGTRINPTDDQGRDLLQASAPPKVLASHLANLSSQPFGHQIINSGVVPRALSYINIPYGQQHFTNPILPSTLPPFALTPLGMFPDGSALISCNGICYRSYWNGMTTIMDPITTGQSIPVSNDPTGNYPSTLPNGSPYGAESYGTLATSVACHHNSQPNDSKQNSAPPSEETVLKAQLTNLDKHLALNHYEISPAQKSELVSQRMSLVETIAKIRNDREPVKVTIPMVPISRNASRKPSAQSEVHNRGLHSTGQPELDLSHDTSLNEIASLKKGLSPSAPAFVPSSAKESFTSSLKQGSMPKNIAAVTLSNPSTADNKASGNELGDVTPNGNRLQDASYGSESQPFVEVDHWDPAMKIVPLAMIEYAQKYNHDRTDTAMKFCTRAEEFQEAIRRVREQARMWGCLGGNSKDPAYDAEEDIWYAIKDEYPIPLPTEVPDHITCPRPWNWYDSAFNVKATIKPQINMRGDTFEDAYAHPKKEATSAKCIFEDILPSTKTELEAAKDTSQLHIAREPPITLALSSHDNVPFQMQVRDTLVDYNQNQHKQTSSRWLFKTNEHDFSNHADESGSAGMMDTVAPMLASQSKNPGFPSTQRRYESPPFRAGAESSHFHSSLHETIRVQDESVRPRSIVAKGLLGPSVTAVSAAKAAFNSKAPKASRSLHAGIETCLGTPFRTRNKSHFSTPIGFRAKEGAGKLNDQTCKQKSENSGGNSHRGACYDLTSSNNGKSTYGPAHKLPTPDAPDSSGITNAANDRGASKHRANCMCIFCHPYEWSDSRMRSTSFYNGLENFLSTESKGSWDPDHLCTTMEKNVAPKVNIPSPTTSYGMGYNRGPHEVKLESISRIPNINSDSFLKDMLRNPRYSFNVQYNDGTPMEPLMAYQIAHNERGRKFSQGILEQQHMQQVTDKENATPAHGSIRNNVAAKPKIDFHSTIARGLGFRRLSTAHKSPHLPINKASCSLASSAYHAQGYLPPYIGAGKAQATSIHQQQPYHTLHDKPRVHLPISSSYSQHEDSCDQVASNDRYSYTTGPRCMPITLGYDGSGDLPASDDVMTRNSKGKETEDPPFDGKGITAADFDQHRPDHNNETHRDAVNEFFRDLHEKEIKNMMARQRKNSKTIP